MSSLSVNGKRMARSQESSLTEFRSFQVCGNAARHGAFFIFRNRASVKVLSQPAKSQKAISSWRLCGGEVVTLPEQRSANHHVNSGAESCRAFYGRASRDIAIKSTAVSAPVTHDVRFFYRSLYKFRAAHSMKNCGTRWSSENGGLAQH